ncbi:hypothetical protein MJM43_29550, partial [Salmonella enterica subsp. enterica serovar Montevideo]|nr:hypothetical protein [Salmonella enterica subsp. enterica serovar Montevideo]
QKVSTELNRPFAIRGDLGVVWERQKQETGWRSWVPWPHVHADAKFFTAFTDMGTGIMLDSRRKIGPKGKFRPFVLYAAFPVTLL